METSVIVANKLERFIIEKKITKFSIVETLVKDAFKCTVNFGHNKKTLETTFIWNFNRQPYSENGYKIYYGDEDIGHFLKQQISNRRKGEINEIRVLGIAKKLEATHISPEIKVLQVLAGSDYADNKLKADILLIIGYTYIGKFDGLPDTCSFMIGIQIKSSRVYQLNHVKHHPYIPSIIAHRHMTDEDIQKNLSLLLINATRFKYQQLYLSFIETIGSPELYVIGGLCKKVYNMIHMLHM